MTRSLAVSVKLVTPQQDVGHYDVVLLAFPRAARSCTTSVQRLYNVCTTYVQRMYNGKHYIEHYVEHKVEHNCDYIYRVYETIFIGSPRCVMD